MKRRDWLSASTAGALSLGLAGCLRPAAPLDGGFEGASFERGHLLREKPQRWPAPAVSRRVSALVLGGGIAGLAAARALRQGGVDDLAVLEMADQPGGNSRGRELGGLACPTGAHYLPVPGDDAREVQDLLEELGLRRREAGRWVYDEQALCHSPQERLYQHGEWHEGLLPSQDLSPAALAQYQRFASLVAQEQKQQRYTLPLSRQTLSPGQLALDTQTFAHWLNQQGLNDAGLRWYLDYCCRDDYGAGAEQVSAWAGLHYFASRHGFQAPGSDAAAQAAESSVLTWPEGNGWLVDRLAAPLQGSHRGGPLYTGRLVLRIEDQRHAVAVDVWDVAQQRVERWLAAHCVVALPVPVAARVQTAAPDWLQATTLRWQHAAWVVGNLQLAAPLADRPGAAPAWDNVAYGSAGLGYVNAAHQRLDPRPGPTVLTFYSALGTAAAARRDLLTQPWTHWRDLLLKDYLVPHPDLFDTAQRFSVTRHGHAMAVPVPGTLAHLSRLPGGGAHRGRAPSVPAVLAEGRLSWAHSDWSGYSVFEEAFTRGHDAGRAVAQQLRGRLPA
ncbi:FAD-dependent oxidoreductase [Curvibacter sp. HBC61]|uniref:FAD-dependent oxidoreductase n=1 Tax=Curvibacter cyanobacteriorum TaxID=3026422 RepID=A0ABT5MZK2_9BURK|nr:FAD-dependent oxidoreductase [Curvibacter sp. HBC61]MDD0839505.1 FAD-dependent oxidoreductase [Curvibacter sp. HBC61]